ncbi:hypothetical protein JXR93_00705 [bacterium]|nr:hypothetical protein [bacterium]
MRKISYTIIALALLEVFFIGWYVTVHLKILPNYGTVITSQYWSSQLENPFCFAFQKLDESFIETELKVEIGEKIYNFKTSKDSPFCTSIIVKEENISNKTHPQKGALINSDRIELKFSFNNGKELENIKIPIYFKSDFDDSLNNNSIKVAEKENLQKERFIAFPENPKFETVYILSNHLYPIPFEKNRIYIYSPSLAGKTVFIDASKVTKEGVAKDFTFDLDGVAYFDALLMRVEGDIIVDNKKSPFEGKFYKSFLYFDDSKVFVKNKKNSSYLAVYWNSYLIDFKKMESGDSIELFKTPNNIELKGFWFYKLYNSWNLKEKIDEKIAFNGDSSEKNSFNEMFWAQNIQKNDYLKIYNNYNDKKDELEQWKKDRKESIWFATLFISIIIVILIFILWRRAQAKATEGIDYDFHTSRGYWMIYVILAFIAAFFGMILFILKFI